ncbi:MAG: DUF3048 domain-containing protein [Actinomycetota bacterium]|nr:DUF3048 domain-containing protein [Actinomycetota bacterium]
MHSFTKNILTKLIIVSMALAIALTFSIYGCSGQEPVDQQPQDEQPAEEELSTDEQPAEEQEQEESAEGGLHQKIITGNINILSGLEISEQINDSRPIAVMIENSPDSRPQSGLSLADVVFEIVDEGGVTRYVAIYSSYDAEKLGPVRSARQYYGEVACSFDPIYSFWGTYPEGYKLIENMGMDVLSVLGDQSGNSSITAQASHWRDDSRVAPHNGYMSTLQLKEDAQRLGYALDGGQSPFMFKLDAPLSERGNIDQVTVDFSYGQYKAVYEYEGDNNNYLKSVGNAAHMDRETDQQIVANNIVVMITDIANSGDADGHMIVRTTNGGKAFFFMDGQVVEGTWDRRSVSEPFDFKDDQGNDILFNRGTTWISMVESIDRVIY